MKNTEEAVDRALTKTPREGTIVNPAGTQSVNVTQPQIGIVPLSRTLAKPRAYKPTKGAP